MRRILLDPAADAAGGGTTTTTTMTPATPAAPATPTPTPAAATLTISADEFSALYRDRQKLQEVETANKKALDDAENKRLLALAEKGNAEKALTDLRTAKDAEIAQEKAKTTALENTILAGAKSAALAAALLGAKFVSDAAGGQALQLLGDRFEAVRDAAGVVQVREKGTGLPASQVVKAWLESKDAAHFLDATSKGGSGSKGGDQTTPTPGTTPPAPGAALTDEQLLKLPYDQRLVAVMAQQAQAAAAANPYRLGLRPQAQPQRN